MIIGASPIFLAASRRNPLSPVIKRQHNQQGEADGRSQGQGQQPKEQREARALGGLVLW
jgi:hypothetical protein